MTLKRISCILAALIIVLSCFQRIWAETAATTTPRFNDIIVTTSEKHLLLFADLQDSLTEEMLTGLHSGIPINFSFFVELEKNEPHWPNDKLVSLSFSHKLLFDTLKETYIVETDEASQRKFTSESLDDAIKILNEINGIKVIKLEELEPESMYKLRLKADLYKKTLPMSLHNIIPFISWWDLSVDWNTVEFKY